MGFNLFKQKETKKEKEMKRTTHTKHITIEKELYNKTKEYCVVLGTTFSGYISQALRDKMRKDKALFEEQKEELSK